MAAPTFLSLLRADATREQLETWCRDKAQSYPVSFERGSHLVCRVLGKYIMYCADADSAIAPQLALSGIWEPWITMAIARHVKPGMRCMDVGACYGYYALLMADIVGSAGKVQAWEPVWNRLTCLNAEVNGLEVEVVNKAMAPIRGQLEITPPRRGWFFNAGDVKLSPVADAAGRRIEMLREQAPPVTEPWDFIKIDVEGAEADVWQALAGVREVSPGLTVCMEFTPLRHESPDAFLQRLVADGFTMGTVGHDGVPRACSLEEAVVPDTGGFRMLWLTRGQ